MNGFHAVVQIKDLSASLDFPLDGMADKGLIVGDDMGFNGLAFLRGGFNGG